MVSIRNEEIISKHCWMRKLLKDLIYKWNEQKSMKLMVCFFYFIFFYFVFFLLLPQIDCNHLSWSVNIIELMEQWTENKSDWSRSEERYHGTKKRSDGSHICNIYTDRNRIKDTDESCSRQTDTQNNAVRWFPFKWLQFNQPYTNRTDLLLP